MSDDNIINIVDRLIARTSANAYSVDVTSLTILIERELTEVVDVHQRFSLATLMANALLDAILEMHRKHGATRSEIISALTAAAKAIAKRDLFSLNE
jgi:hypothetical protein